MRLMARGMAIAGGTVLTLLVLLVCASVIGRALNGLAHGALSNLAPALSAWMLEAGVGPVNGDFELVEAGVAFAIFAFMPLCQITQGHATVDIFTSKLGAGTNRVLRMITDIIFAIVLIVIAVQLYAGMMSKLGYGETTFLLQFPVWWGYAASLIGAVCAAIMGCYVAAMRSAELFTGREILPDGPEDGH